MTIPDPIRAEILRRLAAVEAQHDVRVLYAIESGSRAWGFASPDSDYDVRFVYAHPREWYLSINVEDCRDVIEQPIVDEIDLSGWDVRKALRLLRKTNPGIGEWLHSPIVYVENGTFAEQARAVQMLLFNPQAAVHHYRNLARHTVRDHLTAERVRAKKYFYALRGVLSARWIIDRGEPPAIDFQTLVEGTVHSWREADVREAIADLLAAKVVQGEAEPGPHIAVLDELLADELSKPPLTGYSAEPSERANAELNTIFRSVL